MTETARGTARQPGISYQDYLDQDSRPVPEELRYEVNDYMGDDDIPVERYISYDFHRQEVDKLWRKAWQFACREEDIPNIGDHIVYEIVDDSLIVVRTAPDEIKAYFNACLHRGRKLRTHGGNVPEFRCSFHGFTWDLEGKVKQIPCVWDFQHVDTEKFLLPEAKVDTWAGFVFINMDPYAEPLYDFLGSLPAHFARWPLEKRYKSLHVAAVTECNWKIAQEAFMESYHVIATHPQLLPWMGDANAQYDVPPGENWNRHVTPQGVPSPHVAEDVTEDDVLESYYFSRAFYSNTQGRDLSMPASGDLPKIDEGDTARRILADRLREQLQAVSGADLSQITDSELIDGFTYFLFPNFHPWAGVRSNIVYRFRPYGDDPDRSISEVMFLSAYPEGTDPPPPAKIRWLQPGELVADIEEMGLLGPVFDQDLENVPYVQQGLKTSRKAGVTLGTYQESRIRHFHKILENWMNR